VANPSFSGLFERRETTGKNQAATACSTAWIAINKLQEQLAWVALSIVSSQPKLPSFQFFLVRTV
jgi:hypothetical protein